MAGAGDGDVAEAGVEQVRMDAGVGIDEDTLGCESLGAVAGNGIYPKSGGAQYRSSVERH